MRSGLCYFSPTEYGWWRWGKFYPYEVWGDSPFLA